MWLLVAFIGTAATVVAAPLALRWRIRRRRQARARAFAARAQELADEARAAADLVRTLTLDARRADAPVLWHVASGHLVRLSQWTFDLHCTAPTPAARSAIDGVHRSLVILERTAASHRARTLTTLDAPDRQFRLTHQPVPLARRVDDLAVAATFLAIVVNETAV
jgi:hypothetical protein